MIIVDAMDLLVLGVGAVLLAICGIVLVIDRIACAVRKRQQKRIDEAYKQEADNDP